MSISFHQGAWSLHVQVYGAVAGDFADWIVLYHGWDCVRDGAGRSGWKKGIRSSAGFVKWSQIPHGVFAGRTFRFEAALFSISLPSFILINSTIPPQAHHQPLLIVLCICHFMYLYVSLIYMCVIVMSSLLHLYCIYLLGMCVRGTNVPQWEGGGRRTRGSC